MNHSEKVAVATMGQSTLIRWSRLLIGLGISGLYLSLAVAAIFYINLQDPATAKVFANDILIVGLMLSAGFLLAGWLLLIVNKATKTNTQPICPLLGQSQQS